MTNDAKMPPSDLKALWDEANAERRQLVLAYHEPPAHLVFELYQRQIALERAARAHGHELYEGMNLAWAMGKRP